jgi:hypothetical protein
MAVALHDGAHVFSHDSTQNDLVGWPNEHWTSTMHTARKADALRVAVAEAIMFGFC